MALIIIASLYSVLNLPVNHAPSHHLRTNSAAVRRYIAILDTCPTLGDVVGCRSASQLLAVTNQIKGCMHRLYHASTVVLGQVMRRLEARAAAADDLAIGKISRETFNRQFPSSWTDRVEKSPNDILLNCQLAVSNSEIWIDRFLFDAPAHEPAKNAVIFHMVTYLSPRTTTDASTVDRLYPVEHTGRTLTINASIDFDMGGASGATEFDYYVSHYRRRGPWH